MSLPVAHGLVGSALLVLAGPRIDFCSRRTAWALALVLPVVPDFDFAAVWFFGQPNEVWHRTGTHSLVGTLLAGLLAAFIVRRRGVGSPRWAFLFVGALILSHAVVDMFSHGHFAPGRGVKLFWPWLETWVASPWQPLPPGLRGNWGIYLRTAALELLYLGPPVALLAWTVNRRRRLRREPHPR